jgi:hypothetical protein
LRRAHLTLGLDCVLALTFLDAASRQLEVLRLQRVRKVLNSEPVTGQARRIDQHVDLALATTDQVDRAYTCNALHAHFDYVFGQARELTHRQIAGQRD